MYPWMCTGYVGCPSLFPSFLLPSRTSILFRFPYFPHIHVPWGRWPHPQVLGMGLTGLRVIPPPFPVTGLGMGVGCHVGHWDVRRIYVGDVVFRKAFLHAYGWALETLPAHYIGMRNHAVPIATGPQGKQASGWSRQKTTRQKSRNNLSLLGSHWVAGATNLTACLTFGLVVKWAIMLL